MTIHHVRDGKLKKYERVAAQKEKKIDNYQNFSFNIMSIIIISN